MFVINGLSICKEGKFYCKINEYPTCCGAYLIQDNHNIKTKEEFNKLCYWIDDKFYYKTDEYDDDFNFKLIIVFLEGEYIIYERENCMSYGDC